MTLRKKAVGVRHKKVVGDLSCTSEIIENLLTVILRNNFFRFDGTVWSQLMIEGIAGQYMRFVPFPRVHDGDQSSNESEVIVEAIGQVGSGQVMIYSGSARAISSVHGVIYLITCLSNRDHIPLFHPAPSILETSPSTCHCLSVLFVLVWSRHSQVRHLHCYRLSLGQLHSARLLSLILLHFPSKYPLRPLSAVLPTLFLLGV